MPSVLSAAAAGGAGAVFGAGAGAGVGGVGGGVFGVVFFCGCCPVLRVLRGWECVSWLRLLCGWIMPVVWWRSRRWSC
ncbi:hypothetical protein SSCG_06260 [Streptomyces clavuligerus]|nr:hypothetical protein SSCG_06260 [Streptomyces clavuligerus]